jgi:two-component system KDP operon response regulator KdpE
VRGYTVARVSRLVLIEDDDLIRGSLERALRERGHEVRSAAAGLDGLSQIVDASPDAVILDLGLPDVDGLELLRMLRAVSAVPVVVATARDEEGEIVRTLDAGADDYVVKPFTIAQLDARLRAVLRRVNMDDDVPLVVGGLRIDVAARVATLDGVEIDLARKEFDLLAHLAAQPGKVVTKRELLAEIWDLPYGGGDKTVDVHLSWLRRKLGETAAAPRYLRAVRGVGVKLVPPEQ